MKAPRPVARALHRFVEEPASVRNAMRVIIAATVAATFGGGTLVWLFDRADFPTFGDALWWALQTVTTVGYGDITPKQPAGRLIGSLVLLYAVAFLAILTAAITTSFVEKERVRRGTQHERADSALLDRLDDIAARLDRLEQQLGERSERG